MSHKFKLSLLSSLLVLPLMGVVACSPSTITVFPDTGKVSVGRGDKLYTCDQAVEACSMDTMDHAARDIAVNDKGEIIMITNNALYRCNDRGQSCDEISMPAKVGKPVRVSVAATGQVVVVGTKQVAVCPGDATTCGAKTTDPPPSKKPD